jgi:hypothetical protein
VPIANNTFAFPNGGGQDGQIMLWDVQSNLAVQNNIFYHPPNCAIAQYDSTVSSCAIDHYLLHGAGNRIGLPVSGHGIARPLLVNRKFCGSTVVLSCARAIAFPQPRHRAIVVSVCVGWVQSYGFGEVGDRWIEA